MGEIYSCSKGERIFVSSFSDIVSFLSLLHIYLAMGAVGAIFLVILAATQGVNGYVVSTGIVLLIIFCSPKVLNLVMTLANAYGLILVVILMGYGLVDIPRYVGSTRVTLPIAV